MSAIGVVFSRGGAEVTAEPLRIIGEGLKHLGHKPPAIELSQPIGMTCCQAVVTPEDLLETQPNRYADGSLLCWDGRLDHRENLIGALGLRVNSDTLTDSALAWEAYQKWGNKCFEQLVGDYALAIWDASTQQLYCACDPMGGRSLYYMEADDQLLIASLPTVLFKVTDKSPRVNHQRVVDELFGLFADMETSLFEGVRTLPPKHLLIADRNRLSVRYFWQFDAEHELQFKSESEMFEALDEHFMNAVSSSLRSISPVAVSLSGGLDSSAIAWAAASDLSRQGGRLQCYTALPHEHYDQKWVGNWITDPTYKIEALQRKLGNLDTSYHHASRSSGFEYTWDGFKNNAAPPLFPIAHRYLYPMYQAAGENGNQVMLDGLSGNLTFSWDGKRRLSRLFHDFEWLTLWNELRAYPDSYQTSLKKFYHLAALPNLPAVLQQLERWRTGNMQGVAARSDMPHILRKNARVAFNPVKRFQRYGLSAAQLPPGGNSRHNRVAAMTTSRKVLAYARSPASFFGRWKIETRDPMRDRKLVEFLIALPDVQYLHQGVERRLIKRSMQGRLPEEIIDGPRERQSPDVIQCMKEDRGKLLELEEEVRGCEPVENLIDLDVLRNLISNLSREEQAGHPRPPVGLIQQVLSMALFMKWAEQR